MSRFSNMIMAVAYILGVITVVIAVLVAFVPRVKEALHLTPRGGLVFAATLFLCAIASYAVKMSSATKS